MQEEVRRDVASPLAAGASVNTWLPDQYERPLEKYDKAWGGMDWSKGNLNERHAVEALKVELEGLLKDMSDGR